MTNKESERAIANLIASTRTTKRSVSLVEFYNWLCKAIKGLGGLDSVADRIGLSTRMLKQFLVIESLDPSILPYVEKRTLDSVDALNYLARFSKADQRSLLPILLSRELTSKDLRSVYQQRSVLPTTPILELVNRVSAGKARRVYELQFVLRGGLSKRAVRDRVQPIVGDSPLNIEFDGPIGKIIVSKEGLQKLREYARGHGVSFKKVLSHLLYIR